MTPTRIVRGAAALLGLLMCASAVAAQDWANAMFDHTTHDFGVVARGAKVEHRFTIENAYEEDVHIKSVSSTCGCSTPTVNRQLLKTWEKADVLVTLDTRGFLGRKDATIRVEFDQPFQAEVQLHVHAYIRSDIVLQPGAVSFGPVPQGTGATQVLSLTYAGRDDWRITRIESANPSLEATAIETSRSPGKAAYSLTATLKPDAPPGYIRDQLIVVTNDYDLRAARVPVAVEGLVMSALSVRPSPLMMGAVDANESVTRNIVVQGRAPFHILAVRASDPQFKCKPPSEAKTTHVVPVTFHASGKHASSAAISSKLHIETDLPGANAVDVTVTVQVAPSASTKSF